MNPGESGVRTSIPSCVLYSVALAGMRELTQLNKQDNTDFNLLGGRTCCRKYGDCRHGSYLSGGVMKAYPESVSDRARGSALSGFVCARSEIGFIK
jgi:hypothetical protein